jgi:hypothetical protein
VCFLRQAPSHALHTGLTCAGLSFAAHGLAHPRAVHPHGVHRYRFIIIDIIIGIIIFQNSGIDIVEIDQESKNQKET